MAVLATASRPWSKFNRHGWSKFGRRKQYQVDQQKMNAWNIERDKGEPNHVHQYRASLLRCACVRQLFDPWFMNIDTHRAGPLEPNMQKSGNETLHAHHLHISVDDPHIL